MKNKQAVLYVTPKSSYYNSKKEVVEHVNEMHDQLFKEDRVLYTYLLYFKNATYYSKSLIMQRLLKNSLHKTEHKHFLQEDERLLEVEDALIHYALFNENITHAIKMLLSLKEKRINNSRTSRIILRFIFERGNADYIAIKYKQKIQELLIHALGFQTAKAIVNRTEEGMQKFNKFIAPYNNQYALEVIDFVFNKEREYRSEYFQEYNKVKQQFIDGRFYPHEKTKLPIEVLIGFNNYYKRHYNIVALLNKAVVSDKQKVQLQNAVKRHAKEETNLEIDYNKYSIIELLKVLYNKDELTVDEQLEINNIIREKANEIKSTFDFGNNTDTAIIFDCSDSHAGSNESRLHPLYKNLLLEEILMNDKTEVFYVGGTRNERGLLMPSGDSDLSSALLHAVEKGYENIIVLSDGYENVGSFDKVYKQLQAIGHKLHCIHFNPVFSPKNFSFKELSDEITTIPFLDEKDISFLHLYYLLNKNPYEFKKVIREKIERELLSC